MTKGCVKLFLDDENATLILGAALAGLLYSGCERCKDRALSVHLEGDLGAGKTTLTRGLLRTFGYKGTVKSPTYTLVEGYVLPESSSSHTVLLRTEDDTDSCECLQDAPAVKTVCLNTDFEVFHFDLYRLADPEELELMGIRDYFAKRALCLIEWPDRGEGYLPDPDLTVTITHEEAGRAVELSSPFFSEEDMLSAVKTLAEEKSGSTAGSA